MTEDMNALLTRLRAMGLREHDDFSIADEAADEIERLRAERDEARAALEWQPIKTAPKDGTHFLAYWPGLGGLAQTITETWWGGSVNRVNGSAWHSAYEEGEGLHGPTHWRPLPPPPEGDR